MPFFKKTEVFYKISCIKINKMKIKEIKQFHLNDQILKILKKKQKIHNLKMRIQIVHYLKKKNSLLKFKKDEFMIQAQSSHNLEKLRTKNEKIEMIYD